MSLLLLMKSAIVEYDISRVMVSSQRRSGTSMEGPGSRRSRTAIASVKLAPTKFRKGRVEATPAAVRAVTIRPRAAANGGDIKYELQNTAAIDERYQKPMFLFAADHRNPLSVRTIG